MALHLYDTLSRAKRPFEPLDPARVRLYVCGPTVYNTAHVGNARPVVVFDVLFRLLRHHYGPAHVTYARNITDIDDKIIDAAAAEGVPIDTIAARYTELYHRDMDALGALRPSLEPRATAHLDAMAAMITRLIDGGHAYEAEGHVLFHVPSMADYGALSHRSRDEQVAGARVEVAPFKRDPADFVLWKPSAADQPGWDSPWGRGRPGWHLECSAMIEAHLGQTIDIHAGGQDLIFPHHENEIAQSACCHGGAPLARYWLHNGYLLSGGEKMSKSLGNFHTVHALLDDHPGEAIRLALLSARYRQPLDFTPDLIRDQKRRLDRWYRTTADVAAADTVPASVIAALDDDLNTPAAISALEDLAPADLKAGAQFLGLLGQDADAWFKGGGGAGGEAQGPSPDRIDALIEERRAARKARDFARADQIRDELAGQGVRLLDRPDGSTDWERS
ncbi:cysteinyl-tRNA synthetase [Rhodothalassium salexigens DSM 2132]|uniref:Cysteine--tRNA ligase n=1 Tax=Rhodothalassium salexigens DSM 2132 TaxID=1188247 RepID=A0A4V2SQ63_RHOSA|nr:cysteine--tRNA ligase [Rhodothalassium salexigens]MBB4210567.1 cysteinyl-tRNA synthetase [Rhodothalassium salexigens DSM 2132]MBK1639987.1 cysteine--tRNA ligase [Rhodothalassium salexigens DSM 2132]TCP37876.1 cysteinyl-tRNA synthetase [Rhodothalassium salexigens DSM 2132]